MEGWVLLRSMFTTANGVRFATWLTTHLFQKLRREDVLVMNNLRVHHNLRVAQACLAHGAPATALRLTTAVSGVSTPAIRLNPGDPWG